MRFHASLLTCALLLLASLVCCSSVDETYSEHLLLRPLPDGRLQTSFDFTIDSSSHSSSHFRLLPRPLLQLVEAHNASEVHLSLNTGRWQYRSWGSPARAVGGDDAVASGAQLTARFNDPNPLNNSLPQWKRLTSGLAGLFCASLNALDERHTVTTGPETLHAFLPSETVCTENLTPLLKLLPCKAHAGLASLLNPLALFAANFQGLAVHVTRKDEHGWQVRLTVQAVFSPALTRDVSRRDWSLTSIFQRALASSCPLATQSTVRVLTPDDQGFISKFQLHPLPARPANAPVPQEEEDDDDDKPIDEAQRLARQQAQWQAYLATSGEFVYDVRNLSAPLDISMTWPEEERFRYRKFSAHFLASAHTLNFGLPSSLAADRIAPPVLSAERTLVGHGQQRSELVVTLRNTHATASLDVEYADVLPWFVKPYLHTLRTVVKPHDDVADADPNIVRFTDDLSAPVKLSYSPSLPRARPFHIIASVRVPPASTVTLHLDVDRAFLRYAEHPPDAHRGFDIPPARITTAGTGKTLYTLPRLVELATPDFSFVYTNIIFTSTVIALFFGSTLNGMVRTFTDIVL